MRIYAYFFKWHKKFPLGIGAQGLMTSSEKPTPVVSSPQKKFKSKTSEIYLNRNYKTFRVF